MLNTEKLESIKSVCTTPKELITSDDFIRGVEIILDRVKIFDKETILSIFKKLKNGEVLDENEKGVLSSFITNEQVEKY